MEFSNILPTNKPEAQKCIVTTCDNIVQPKKVGKVWFVQRYCNPCGAKVMAERIIQETKERQMIATKRLSLPPRFAGSTLENFQTEYQPTAFTIARRFIEEYKPHESRRGLFLYGIPGTGKTHLAAAIGNSLKLSDYTRFVTAPELLLQIKKGFGKDEEYLDRLAGTQLLILDDLGSEKPTEWVQETLFVLIDRRYTQYRPTIVTSNFSLDEIKDRLGYRIASRIAEMCEVVELRAKDYRIKQ